jgi:hypothetical protein
LNPKRKGKNYIKNLFKSTTIMLSPDFQFIFWVWIVFLNKKFHWKKAWNILDFFFIKVRLKTKARKRSSPLFKVKNFHGKVSTLNSIIPYLEDNLRWKKK